MTSDKVMTALDKDELRFIQALNSGDEAVMIAIFAKKNGTLTDEAIEKRIAAPEADPGISQPEISDNVKLDTDLTAATLTFIEAWKAGNIEALQRLINEKSGPTLPPSHVARERTRARRLDPEIRFRILGVLEEIETLISDTSYRVLSDRPHYREVGVFESDAIATELLHAVIDYLSLYPSINQISSEYHVRPHFDLEWDYSKRTLTALDPAGNTQAVEDYSDPDD